MSKKARAEVGQWQQQQSKTSANQQRQQAQQQQQQAAAKRQSKDAGLVDMHQFWKYFHLVPAQVSPGTASKKERNIFAFAVAAAPSRQKAKEGEGFVFLV